MTILGIDPGSQHLGLSLLEISQGKALFLTAERISPVSGDLTSRMASLITRLESFLDTHHVDAAAIEEGFLSKNVKTVEVLAKIRGMLMTLLLQRRIPFYSYSPRTVKLAVTGYGNAEKEQLRKGLTILLGSKIAALSDDESDALAIAYCHYLKERT